MKHRLLFLGEYELDLQLTRKDRLQRVRVLDGELIEANVRPRIEETAEGPVEMADLQLDGGTLLSVRMECFRFFEENEGT